MSDTISIADQITAVEREIGFRERFYPRWIDQKKLTQLAADQELAKMRAVRDTLIKLRDGLGLDVVSMDEAAARRDERLRVLACLNESFPFGIYTRIEARIRAKMVA